MGAVQKRDKPAEATKTEEPTSSKKWRDEFSSSVQSVMTDCASGIHVSDTLGANLAQLKAGFNHLLQERVRLEVKLLASSSSQQQAVSS